MNPKVLFRIRMVPGRSFFIKGWGGAVLLLLSLILFGLAACRPEGQAHPAGVVWDSVRLAGPPNSDDGSFQPEGTTREDVLAERRAARSKIWQHPVHTVDGLPVMDSLGSGRELQAVLRTSEENPPRQIVEVLDGEQILFRTDAGLPSPALPLRGLWSYGEHWVVEILQAEDEVWKGEIYRDGKLLNAAQEYQEAFGFQLLDGKPFYFFQREDQLGFSYDGKEAELPFDHIPHYNCCSATTINPVQAQDLAAFFARDGEDWYYVELFRQEK